MKNYVLIMLTSLVTVMAPVKPMMIITFLAIVLDTCFGIWKSVKINGWKAFRSRRLSDVAVKFGLYNGAILFTFLIERFVAGDIIAHFISVDLLMTKFVALFCVIVEVKSINESIEDVTGKNVLQAMRRFISRSKKELDKWT